MKTLLSLLLVITLSHVTIGQTTTIPDSNFELALINLGLDTGIPNGTVPTVNIDTLTSLDVSSSSINNLTGIEDFTDLAILDCSWNQITTLNVTQNTKLIDLNCRQNQLLSSINVTQNQLLETLECGQTQITNLDVSQNINLTKLRVRFLDLTTLDVSQNLALTWLDCYNNQLSALNITNNTALDYLNCSWNQIISLDVTQNSNLSDLSCNNNLLTNINVSLNPLLESLSISYNQLTTLNVTNNSLLNFLSCWNNQLTTINLPHNPLLYSLGLSNNTLSELSINQNPLVVSLTCDGNQLTCLRVKNGNNTNFISFQTFNNPNLYCIDVDDATWATANWPLIDSTTSFSTNCNNPCTAGINENKLSNIIIYPNPTNGSINIDLEETGYNINLHLTNAIGQIILVENYKSTSNIRFDIDSPKGVYFLRLESDGEIITKKIIKE